MMSNRNKLEKSAKIKSLYKFFKDNDFLSSDTIKLKYNYSKGKGLNGLLPLQDNA